MHSASELARRSKSPRGLALEVPSEAIQYRTLNRSYWAGSTTAEYIFFGGQRIAMIPAGSNPLYYVEDLLGTSRIVADNAGVVCYDADFYPFGGERAYTNTCPQNNYKFEGKERDTETGNDDFGARYYSNRFGRWLSADWSNVPTPVPYANLTNPQTLNLYAMVSDDPESFADLDGHLLNFGRSPNPYDPSEPCLHASWFCLPPAAYTDSAAQQEAQQQQNQSAQAQDQTPQSAGVTIPFPLISGAAGTAAAATAATGAMVVGAAALLIHNITDTIIQNNRDKEKLAAIESIIAAENGRILASQIKETTRFLQKEQTNFLGHIKWTTPENSPNPNDRNRWIRQLQNKIQNMKDVLKRLPDKSRIQWERTIQGLEDMLPK